ncbi:MAG: hypothetical protein ACR2HN_03280 [Tepidiformaceae bacterium]
MTSLETLDSPLRTFFQELAPLAGSAEDSPHLPEIAGLLAELARDEDYFAHHMAGLPTDRFAGIPLHAPERGPRLLLVHRPEGLIGAIHSHSVWVVITPVTGTETHRRYEVASRAGNEASRARIEMTEERHIAPGEHVTLVPPRDIHAHGHGRGIGEPAYILILTGDDQFRYAREEFDAEAGTARSLAPGDRGN